VVFDQAENRLWAQEALLSLIFDAKASDGRGLERTAARWSPAGKAPR
jgi:hypothetical protein